MVSNPEFLREGSAIHDSFYGDRIVIGADDAKTADVMEEVNKPLMFLFLKQQLEVQK